MRRFALPLLTGLAVVAAPVPVRAAEGPAPAATVIEVEGAVTWHAAGETAFRAAQGGEQLFPGARIRTGARSFATLKWKNGGDFKLFPLSELEVPEQDGVLLNQGQVWAEFKKKLLGPFFFKAPGATAVVRGTTLGVEVRPAGETFVAVWEGRVEVLGAAGQPSRMLEPGQSVLVSPMGLFGPLQPVQPRDFELRGRMRSSEGPRMAPMGDPQRGPRPEGPPPADRATAPGRVNLEWLSRNRAAVRLEEARGVERMRRMPMIQVIPGNAGPGDHRPAYAGPNPNGGPGERGERRRPDLAAPNGVASPNAVVNPNGSFPTGRPPKGLELIDCYPMGGKVQPGVEVFVCPPPPAGQPQQPPPQPPQQPPTR